MTTRSKSLVVIRHKASECVGCCLCAETIPQYFQMNDIGLSELVEAENEGTFNKIDALHLDSIEIEKVVEGCPVDIIRMDAS